MCTHVYVCVWVFKCCVYVCNCVSVVIYWSQLWHHHLSVRQNLSLFFISNQKYLFINTQSNWITFAIIYLESQTTQKTHFQLLLRFSSIFCCWCYLRRFLFTQIQSCRFNPNVFLLFEWNRLIYFLELCLRCSGLLN